MLEQPLFSVSCWSHSTLTFSASPFLHLVGYSGKIHLLKRLFPFPNTYTCTWMMLLCNVLVYHSIGESLRLQFSFMRSLFSFSSLLFSFLFFSFHASSCKNVLTTRTLKYYNLNVQSFPIHEHSPNSFFLTARIWWSTRKTLFVLWWLARISYLDWV